MRKSRTPEILQQVYSGIGWNDYISSILKEPPLRELVPCQLYRDADDPPYKQLERWYKDGWNAARTQEEQQGTVVFLLNELLKRMDAGDEWYGTGFDEPMQIVKKIQTAYQEEKK